MNFTSQEERRPDALLEALGVTFAATVGSANDAVVDGVRVERRATRALPLAHHLHARSSSIIFVRCVCVYCARVCVVLTFKQIRRV